MHSLRKQPSVKGLFSDFCYYFPHGNCAVFYFYNNMRKQEINPEPAEEQESSFSIFYYIKKAVFHTVVLAKWDT